MNTFKTALLMLLMMAFVLFVGQWIGGRSGLMMAFLFGSIGNIAAYWFSDKVVLMTSGARPLDEKDAPQVYRIVASIAQARGIPMPKVYLMDTPMLNAFATGRSPSHAAVAVTSGILDALDERELAGVLAHEMSHILHRDILISTIVSVMAGAIYTLIHIAQFSALFGGSSRDDNGRSSNPIVLLVMMIVAPLAATLIQMAISRSREFDADKGAASITGDPLALASALRKISVRDRGYELPPSTAHMFIFNPLSGRSMMSLFSTHPPVEARVAKLEAMVGGKG